jgi:hypothetical protein
VKGNLDGPIEQAPYSAELLPLALALREQGMSEDGINTTLTSDKEELEYLLDPADFEILWNSFKELLPELSEVEQ